MSYLRPLVCFCFAAAFVLPASAEPGDAIGAAVTIVNHVTGEFNRNLRNLETGDDVRQEEIIAVADDSLGELMLRDQTKVALGPGARLTLDRFVYDPNRTGGSIVLNLVKGGFRFITGIAAKPVYSIRTPVASITVRGTVFDLYIEGQEAIWILFTRVPSPSATTPASAASSTILAASCASAPAATCLIPEPGTRCPMRAMSASTRPFRSW